MSDDLTATVAPADAVEATASLLWLSCHRHPADDALRAALAAGADVPVAASASVAHRLPALLWRALHQVAALDRLGEQLVPLSELTEVLRLREAVLVPQVMDLAVTPLVQGGFEPVILKGPAVARRYPGPGLRPFDDIDLLLPSIQHDRAVRLLVGVGWQVSRRSSRQHYDTVLRHRDLPSLPLELHYGLSARYERASALRADTLWDRRVPMELEGTACFGLPLPEELVALCVHAAKPYHTFSRLVWIADLAMVLGHAAERAEDLDWDLVEALAAQGRCRTAVGAALALARHAGAPVPAMRFPMPSRGWRAAALHNLLDQRWPLAGADQPRFHLRFALADSPARRLRLLAGSTHGMAPVKALARLGWSIGRSASRWWSLKREA